MRPAADVEAHAFGERGTGRRDGGPHRSPRALDHLRTPGESDLAELIGAEMSFHHGADIGRRMGESEFAVGRRWRFAQRQTRMAGEALAQQPVLAGGEAMPGRQRQGVVVEDKGLHGSTPLCDDVGEPGRPGTPHA